ncbi:MAG: VCBS repeat-containing protein, partial [Candidatus Latescibacteria bacterium]|nr:VCBS repeat-containing protein [Candidatus Latescibacterota bacterium]
MKKILFIAVGWAVLWCAGGTASAGTLIDSGMDFPRLAASALAWGDTDGDGDADLVIAGERVEEGTCARITQVFRNEGGNFTKLQDLVGVSYGAVAWGDTDGDGDLDLAVSGWDHAGDEVALLYRQNETGGFEEDTRQSALVGVRYSALAWGDYDGDGDLDLIICGMEAGGTPSTRLYKNELGVFQEDVSQAIVYVNKGSVAWADYDKDGDVDLAIHGFDGYGARTAKIYRNDPTGTLREDKNSSSGLSLDEFGQQARGGVVVGQLAWADLDGDGDPDLTVSGWNSLWEEQIEVYKNDPPGLLAGPFSLSFKRVAGALDWGDYDNDGDLDLTVVGRDRYSNGFAFVLTNERGALSEDGNQNLTGLRSGSLGCADVDGDGTLDLLTIGESAANLYKNDETPNAKPSYPEKLRVQPAVTGSGVTFSWGSASDAETPAEGLTYHLRVGTSEGGSNVFSGALGEGPGCVGNRQNMTLLRPLYEGTYYWNVRTVDSGFERSDWWSLDEILRVEQFVGSGQELLNLEGGALTFGDYDNDGDPDLVLCGRDVNGNARTILYENVSGVWTESRESVLEGVQNGDLAWGDYDNDGDL